MLLKCRLFADDSSLQQSSYNVLDIEFKLNHDLHVLETWSNMWLLKFNPSKTKVVCFQWMLMLLYLNYFFKATGWSVFQSIGLLLSHSLSWSEYISFIVERAYKKLRLLKKFKFTVGRKHLSKLYISFIKLTFEYASIVWDGCSAHDIIKIEKVQ